MKKKHFLHYLVLLSVGVFLTGVPMSSWAMEGGQVGQQGVIEFYVDSTEPSESSTTEPPVASSTEEPPVSTSTSSSTVVQKPAGKYPSTGEVVQRSLMLSGAAVIALVLLFFVMKKRKEKRES
ncbi:LPXTG cell wall anchor domain-containing protein [Enterococcus sp. BWM-S5]|uniref:LPXTG cell wall anchor domain-containing protein n=1 Tax=Enterococcus larvae TaxID=2794352 RepID=A0ABS4CPW5_9ENTE|nr:LPXTG cell wall anchor domain-containing protein [Enterococcus larvae]MBP1048115.1 LPXTG cell wall anchor domain-containing protein [Enterococcus larvae]